MSATLCDLTLGEKVCLGLAGFGTLALFGTGIVVTVTTTAVIAGIILASFGGAGTFGTVYAVYKWWEGKNLTIHSNKAKDQNQDGAITSTVKKTDTVFTAVKPQDTASTGVPPQDLASTSTHSNPSLLTMFAPAQQFPNPLPLPRAISPEAEDTLTPLPGKTALPIDLSVPPKGGSTDTSTNAAVIPKTEIDHSKECQALVELASRSVNVREPALNDSEFENRLKEVYDNALSQPGVPAEGRELNSTWSLKPKENHFADILVTMGETHKRAYAMNPIYWELYQARRLIERYKLINKTQKSTNYWLTCGGRLASKCCENAQKLLSSAIGLNQCMKLVWVSREILQIHSLIATEAPRGGTYTIIDSKKMVREWYILFMNRFPNTKQGIEIREELGKLAREGDQDAMYAILGCFQSKSVDTEYTQSVLAAFLSKADAVANKKMCEYVIERSLPFEVAKKQMKRRASKDVEATRFCAETSLNSANPVEALQFFRMATELPDSNAEDFYKNAAVNDSRSDEYIVLKTGDQAEQVLKRMREAFRYYDLASTKGHGLASFKLGNAFSEGDLGQTADQSKAITYYLRVLKPENVHTVHFRETVEKMMTFANEGNKEAQKGLAEIYAVHEVVVPPIDNEIIDYIAVQASLQPNAKQFRTKLESLSKKMVAAREALAKLPPQPPPSVAGFKPNANVEGVAKGAGAKPATGAQPPPGASTPKPSAAIAAATAKPKGVAIGAGLGTPSLPANHKQPVVVGGLPVNVTTRRTRASGSRQDVKSE